MNLTRFWNSLAERMLGHSTIEEHLFGIVVFFIAAVLVALALAALAGASVLYSGLVNATWHDWREVAWLVLAGVLIIVWAETRRWSGGFAWRCGIAYFGPPIVCNGLSLILISMESTTTLAYWVFKYRYFTGFVGAALIVAVYAFPRIVQWIKNRRAEKWNIKIRAQRVDRGFGGTQAYPAPRPFDRYRKK